MSRISPRLQQYNNPESYAMGKEAAKFLIGQLFARQITTAEFEKQFGTVEKYLSWYEIQNDLPNSFTTDGDELCELLKMISPSGAEDYKKECLKRLAEAKKLKAERDKQYALEDAMAAAALSSPSILPPDSEMAAAPPIPAVAAPAPPIPHVAVAVAAPAPTMAAVATTDDSKTKPKAKRTYNKKKKDT